MLEPGITLLDVLADPLIWLPSAIMACSIALCVWFVAKDISDYGWKRVSIGVAVIAAIAVFSIVVPYGFGIVACACLAATVAGAVATIPRSGPESP